MTLPDLTRTALERRFDAVAPYVDPYALPEQEDPEYVADVYDRLADRYDERYDTPKGREEDAEVARWLTSPHLRTARVLDVGCGTGLLLDLLGDRIRPERYTGIDPSQGMLDRLAAKHPTYAECTHPVGLESWIGTALANDLRYDLIVGMYGSPSYAHPEAIESLPTLLHENGTGLLMMLEPGYLPDFHDHRPAHFDTSREAALTLPGAKMNRWHHYWVVTFRGA